MLTIAAIMLAAPSQEPVAEETRSPVAWELVLGNDELWYSLDSVAGSSFGEYIVGGTGREDRVPGLPLVNHPAVWRVNAEGDVLCEFLLEKPSTDRTGRPLESNLVEHVLVALLNDGDALICVNFEEGRPWIVRADTAGRTLNAHELLSSNRQYVFFQSMRPQADGSFVLLGREKQHGLAVRIDEAGTVLRESIIRRGSAVGTYVDGVSLGDGEMLFVENAGVVSPVLPSSGSLWLRRFHPDGQLDKERAIPGRQGRLLPRSGRNTLIVYDAGKEYLQDIRVASLDEDLTIVDSATLLSSEQALYSFRTAPAGDDGFFVCGGRERKPFLAKVGSAGEVEWSTWLQDKPVAPDYHVAGMDADRALIACDAFVQTPRSVKGKIRCLAVGRP